MVTVLPLINTNLSVNFPAKLTLKWPRKEKEKSQRQDKTLNFITTAKGQNSINIVKIADITRKGVYGLREYFGLCAITLCLFRYSNVYRHNKLNRPVDFGRK